MNLIFSGTYTQISPTFCSVATTPSIPTSKLKPFSEVTTFIKAQVFPFWSFFIVPAVLAVRSFSSGVKLSTLICCDKAGNASSTANKISKLSRFISV